ncbi:hypothetical protein [Hymenobacter norwichensis]|uniref:hypothetical protein n=1 Tax=Hymenobacter norwichensis TaxID=223903 RepID=UPI0003B3CAA9|nr:hypothetical protein [Hymenobacter norwichensis]
MKKSIHFYQGCIIFAGVAGILTSCLVSEKDSKTARFLKDPKYPGGIILPIETREDNAAIKYQKKYDNGFKAVNISISTLNKFIENCSDCDAIRIYRTIEDNEIEYEGAIGIVVVGTKEGKEVSKQMMLSYDRCPHNCDDESVFYNK